MRGKFVLLCLLLAVILLSGCVRVVDTAADELQMYAWRGEYENGNIVELSFNGTTGCLRLSNEDVSVELCGLCVFDGDRMLLCVRDSGCNYSFGYRLYGDRVELSYNGSSITLDKIE